MFTKILIKLGLFKKSETKETKELKNCVKGLDLILLTDGVFVYDTAMSELNIMKQNNEIDLQQYVFLVYACNHFNEEGHYRNSLIYKRIKEKLNI